MLLWVWPLSSCRNLPVSESLVLLDGNRDIALECQSLGVQGLRFLCDHHSLSWCYIADDDGTETATDRRPDMRLLGQFLGCSVIWALCVVDVVDAQTLGAYAGASGGVTIEAGSSCGSASCVSPPLGGIALATELNGGVRLGEHAMVGVEASWGRPFSKIQSVRSTVFERDHDTRIISAVVRVRILGPRLWVTGGIGSLRSTTKQVRTVTRQGVVVEGPASDVLSWSSTSMMFGADYKLLERRRVSLVSKVHTYVADRDRGDESVRLKIGPLLVRPTIGLEVVL